LLREQPVPWDQVRKRRVLTRIRAVRAFSRRRRVPWIVAASVGVAAAATAVVLVLALGSPGRGADEPGPAAQGVAQVAQAEQPSTLELADVGRAFLHPGARVSLESRTSKRVELLQRKGKVRYEIERQVEREVVVLASGVEIRVVGTVFTVAIEDGRVSVTVDEGAVVVRDGRRELQIGAGEEVTVAGRGDVRAESDAAEEPVAEEPVEEPPLEPTSAPRRPGKIATPDPAPEEAVEEPEGSPTEEEPPAEEPAPESPEAATLSNLLEQVDAARKQGELVEASQLLDQIAEQFPRDPRAIAAMFTRGNVERALGNHRKAARAYSRCFELAPSGPLAEDAMAESAACWAEAGDAARASDAAWSYLERYPSGTHAGRMRRLAR